MRCVFFDSSDIQVRHYFSSGITLLSGLSTVVGCIALLGSYKFIGVGALSKMPLEGAWGLFLGSGVVFSLSGLVTVSIFPCSPPKRVVYFEVEESNNPLVTPKILPSVQPMQMPSPPAQAIIEESPPAPPQESASPPAPPIMEREGLPQVPESPPPAVESNPPLITEQEVDRLIIDYNNVSNSEAAEENEPFVRILIKARLLISNYFPYSDEKITYGPEYRLLYDAAIFILAKDKQTTNLPAIVEEKLPMVAEKWDALDLHTDFIIFRLAKDRYDNYSEGALEPEDARARIAKSESDFAEAAELGEEAEEKLKELIQLIKTTSYTMETEMRSDLIPVLQVASNQELTIADSHLAAREMALHLRISLFVWNFLRLLFSLIFRRYY